MASHSAARRALPGSHEYLRSFGTCMPRVAKATIAFLGTVKLSEQRPPEHLRLSVTSRGPWGFADGEGTLDLLEQSGKTEVRYAGEVKVCGMIASVGQRLLDGAARMVLGQFFQALEREAAQN